MSPDEHAQFEPEEQKTIRELVAAGEKPVCPRDGTPMTVRSIGGGSFAPLLLTLPLELPSVGPAKAGAALGLLMLVGQIGGFLLPIVSGAMAQASGPSAALAGLAVVHLLVVVPALGLRTR